MIKVTTSNVQEVKAAIQKELDKFSDTNFVTVGIHEDAGDHQGEESGESISNAQLGAILNYGTDDGHIPPRPWLIEGVDSATKEYLKTMQDVVSNGGTLEDALDAIGTVAQAAVQEFMTILSSPPNAESTKAKKGSANPLKDQGHLIGSVTHKTQINKPSTGLS